MVVVYQRCEGVPVIRGDTATFLANAMNIDEEVFIACLSRGAHFSLRLVYSTRPRDLCLIVETSNSNPSAHGALGPWSKVLMYVMEH